MQIHKGRKFDEKYAKDGFLPAIPREHGQRGVLTDITKYTWMSKACRDVSEETTIGMHRLKGMAAKGELLHSIINGNDCDATSKFDNVYGCRHSLPGGIVW